MYIQYCLCNVVHPVPSISRIYDKPLQFDPRYVNSVRLGCRSAPPDTRRVTERDPGAPYPWNSVKVLDARMRAELGGRMVHSLDGEG
jgi:hypothetical protein